MGDRHRLTETDQKAASEMGTSRWVEGLAAGDVKHRIQTQKIFQLCPIPP